MGQLHSLLYREERFAYEEDGKNGLIICDKYIPEELLSELLFHVDAKTLLNCQLVCKRWNTILRSYVWRKKAETVIERQLHFDKDISWHIYYVICSKKSLDKNFIKNHSGRYGMRYWNLLSEGGDGWTVECPPKGASPPPITDIVFEGKEHCFATSYYSCGKEQTVDLLSQGLLPELLDLIQPIIVISEWYSSRCDCPAIYECSAKLIDESGIVVDTYEFRDTIEDERQNSWHRVEYEFKNYGPGVRKVSFRHGGMDKRFWAGHYGSKMAGACVKVILPKGDIEKEESESKSEETSDPELDI